MVPYLIILILVLLCAYKGQTDRKARIALFIIMSLFVGLRDDVGTDFQEYAMIYQMQGDYLEIGFSYIISYLHNYGYSVTYLFVLFAVLSYSFMFFAIEKTDEFKNYPTMVMMPLLSLPFLCNGIRQGLAICIFLFAYHYIKERKPFHYWGCIALAFLFHKSIIITAPLFFLGDKSLSRKKYIIIYLFSFVFVTFSLYDILGPFAQLLESNKRYYGLLEGDSGIGYFSFGLFLELTNFIILLMLSLKNNMHNRFPLLFNLIFIAAVLLNMRIGAPLINRVQIIFTWFCYPMLPLIIAAENKQTKLFVISYYLISYVAMTINYIVFTKSSNMMPYHDVLGIF